MKNRKKNKRANELDKIQVTGIKRKTRPNNIEVTITAKTYINGEEVTVISNAKNIVQARTIIKRTVKARKLHNVNGVLVHKNIPKMRKGKLYRKGPNVSEVPSVGREGGQPGGRGGGSQGGGGTAGCKPLRKEEEV